MKNSCRTSQHPNFSTPSFNPGLLNPRLYNHELLNPRLSRLMISRTFQPWTPQPQTFQPWTFFNPIGIWGWGVHGWKVWGWEVRGSSLGLKIRGWDVLQPWKIPKEILCKMDKNPVPLINYCLILIHSEIKLPSKELGRARPGWLGRVYILDDYNFSFLAQHSGRY